MEAEMYIPALAQPAENRGFGPAPQKCIMHGAGEAMAQVQPVVVPMLGNYQELVAAPSQGLH